MHLYAIPKMNDCIYSAEENVRVAREQLPPIGVLCKTYAYLWPQSQSLVSERFALQD